MCLEKGMKKQKSCWIHVTRVANGHLWRCNYCEHTFKGSTSKIKAHLGLDGETGNIKQCKYYHADPIQVQGNAETLFTAIDFLF